MILPENIIENEIYAIFMSYEIANFIYRKTPVKNHVIQHFTHPVYIGKMRIISDKIGT